MGGGGNGRILGRRRWSIEGDDVGILGVRLWEMMLEYWGRDDGGILGAR